LGGWVAGLQMVVRSTLGSAPNMIRTLEAFGVRNTLVHDFLMEEVFSQQAPEIQDALLRLAVCSRFSESLLAVLSDQQPPAPVFAWIVASGLFVNGLEAASEWFASQPLFAEFLRDVLA